MKKFYNYLHSFFIKDKERIRYLKSILEDIYVPTVCDPDSAFVDSGSVLLKVKLDSITIYNMSVS